MDIAKYKETVEAFEDFLRAYTSWDDKSLLDSEKPELLFSDALEVLRCSRTSIALKELSRLVGYPMSLMACSTVTMSGHLHVNGKWFKLHPSKVGYLANAKEAESLYREGLPQDGPSEEAVNAALSNVNQSLGTKLSLRKFKCSD